MTVTRKDEIEKPMSASLPQQSPPPSSADAPAARSVTPPVTDWLTRLDSRVGTLAPVDWSTYPFFWFARYPQLRPVSEPSGFEVVTSYATSTLQRLESFAVSAGLSEGQRFQLGALVFDLDTYGREAVDRRAKRQELVAARAHGKGRHNRLAAKIDRVLEALQDVDAYLQDLDQHGVLAATVLVPRNLRSAVQAHRDFYGNARAHLRGGERLAVSVDQMLTDLPTAMPPREFKTLATECLTSFFVTECRLSVTEGDIRTARLGNGLWEWRDPVREVYDPQTLGARAAETTRSRRRRRFKRLSPVD
jgi:hypothetical protein